MTITTPEELRSIPKIRRLLHLRQRRPMHMLNAALVGAIAGIAAILFKHAIELVHQWTESISTVPYLVPRMALTVLVPTLCGAAVVWLTKTLAPEASGSGIPQVKSVLIRLTRFRSPFLIPVKFFGGAAVLGTGFSLGREGPTVHLGAAIGDLVARIRGLPWRSRSHLIACGAGAGVAAAFGAPLAGLIFVIEEMRRELSPLTYSSAFVAAVVADGLVRFSEGPGHTIALVRFESPPMEALPLVIAVGLVAGFSGIAFTKCLMRTVSLRFGGAPWRIGAAVGLFVGLSALVHPDFVRGPIDLAGRMLSPDASHSVMWLLALLALKFLATLACYMTGVPGGIFAPILLQGALLGLLTGSCLGGILPGDPVLLPVCGLLGMVAYFSSIVRAPLTGVVLISEMTGNFDMLFMFLVASLCAYAIPEILGVRPIYEALMQGGLSSERALSSDPTTLDITVQADSPMDGKLVRSLKLPAGVLILGRVRSGDRLVPVGDSRLMAGDELEILVNVPDKKTIETVHRLAGLSE